MSRLAAAKALKLAVSRVPVYSPYAVAEHAVALLVTLNRKVHRAFTSHQAFLTREALSNIARTTVNNLNALATGGPFVKGSVLT